MTTACEVGEFGVALEWGWVGWGGVGFLVGEEREFDLVVAIDGPGFVTAFAQVAGELAGGAVKGEDLLGFDLGDCF